MASYSLLHKPLPDDIADRRKLQFIEFLLRVSNEYFGDVVESIFGAQKRNFYTRLLVSVPYTFSKSLFESISIRNEKIAGVTVRIYQPKVQKSSACILFIHGGGWCVMQPTYYDSFINSVVERTTTMVISIKYRRAPEYPFPTPINDCENVYHELVNRKFKDFDIDPRRICIMGDSAGGNLGTVLIQRQLRQNLALPKCQVLIYPVIHALNLKSHSYEYYYQRLEGTSLLNPRMMARWFLLYLGIPATKKNINLLLNNQHIRKESDRSLSNSSDQGYSSSSEVSATSSSDLEEAKNEIQKLFEINGYNPDFAPILGEMLENMCSTLIITAGYDILLDDGVVYAEKLRSKGIKVQRNHYPTAYHGILNMPWSSTKQKIIDGIVKYIEEFL